MLRRDTPPGVRRMKEREKLKRRWRQAGEGDEAGIIGEGGDPGEESAVGPVGGGDARLGRREVDGQVGVGAEVGLPDYGGQRALLVGEATEDQGLGREEESLGVVGRIGGRSRGGGSREVGAGPLSRGHCPGGAGSTRWGSLGALVRQC